MDLLIHKVSISDEAKFDYETTISPNFDFVKKELKEELEFYIQANKKLWYKQYMRLKYIDEQSGMCLMVFIRTQSTFLHMKVWNVVGICNYDDWDEDMEESGKIKSWLDTSINPSPNEPDWVAVMYKNKILLALDLVYDIGGYDDYITAREKTARRLSDKYRQDKPIKPSRIKSAISKTDIDSETANGILVYLNEMLESARARISKDDFYR